MYRAVMALAVVLILTTPALAQDEFKPGSNDTLKWVEPEEGIKQMLEVVKPGMLYFYSAYKADFCKAIEKEIITNKSVVSKLKKFVCMKYSVDKETEILSKYKVEQGEAVVLLLDCQGKVVVTVKEKLKPTEFTSALRKAEKASKDIKKFLDKIEKSYKKGELYFKKQLYYKASQMFQAILKAREGYEEKKGEINSPYFEKSEKKLELIEEEGTKLLIKAKAAIQKDDFGNASVLLSKCRTEFALFPDIIKQVEQAEEDLQRRMQRAQQQGK